MIKITNRLVSNSQQILSNKNHKKNWKKMNKHSKVMKEAQSINQDIKNLLLIFQLAKEIGSIKIEFTHNRYKKKIRMGINKGRVYSLKAELKKTN